MLQLQFFSLRAGLYGFLFFDFAVVFILNLKPIAIIINISYKVFNVWVINNMLERSDDFFYCLLFF